MTTVYKRPRLLKEAHFHYCPGCGHGIINRLLMEVIEEMDLQESAICVAPAGCGMLLYNYFEIDVLESAHGRGAAVATGIKRARPQNLVFSYQGDGDLAAIGTAEGFHAANRGENISVIFVNNGVYGMTGGQMAPTTLLDQVTTTTPAGRDSVLAGHPVRICEVFSKLDRRAPIRTRGSQQAGGGQADEEGHHQGLPMATRRARLLPGRAAVPLVRPTGRWGPSSPARGSTRSCARYSRWASSKRCRAQARHAATSRAKRRHAREHHLLGIRRAGRPLHGVHPCHRGHAEGKHVTVPPGVWRRGARRHG